MTQEEYIVIKLLELEKENKELKEQIKYLKENVEFLMLTLHYPNSSMR